MIELTLWTAWIERHLYSFEIIPDMESDKDRYEYIIDKVSDFDVIMSWNTRVQDIFSASHTIYDPEIETCVLIHGTDIRRRLTSWKIVLAKWFLDKWVYQILEEYMSNSNW